MKDYQNDKYENFFLHIKVSREGLVKFGDFTATALAAPDVEALIAGHAPTVAAAVTAMRAELVTRKGRSGGSQSGTSAEDKAFEAFKTFLQATDAKVLKGYFYDHEDERDTYYPDGLAGLTQAPVEDRLTRLTAYTEALEASEEGNIKAQGVPARKLLKLYEKASTTKTKARTALQETIGKMGPAGVALAEALWDAHTAACYAHRRAPKDARRYFDYASLPNRVYPKKKGGASKVA
jgi:hypothetical protein